MRDCIPSLVSGTCSPSVTSITSELIIDQQPESSRVRNEPDGVAAGQSVTLR
jgi:hypothetical protein